MKLFFLLLLSLFLISANLWTLSKYLFFRYFLISLSKKLNDQKAKKKYERIRNRKKLQPFSKVLQYIVVHFSFEMTLTHEGHTEPVREFCFILF